MGDRHGGCFARRGRTLSPPRPRVDAHRGVDFRWRAVVGRICPTRERSPRRRPPDTAHGRKDLPRGGSRSPHMPTNGGPLPTDGQPEKHPFGGVAPETAHERKDLPRAKTLPSAKASRHGARAKGFAPRRNAPLGEGLPTRRTGERICPAGFAFAPRADERRATPDRRTAGKTPFRRGRTRDGAAAAEFIHRKK